MTKTTTDWAEVQHYYQMCRSYKQTAEKFGISPDSVRTRARRGGWSVQNEPSECSNEHPIPAGGTLLPTLRNFTSREVEMRAPWHTPIRAREDYADKMAFKAHLGKPETEDCLYSGILGQHHNLRIGRDNPPATMLAVVADYDDPMTETERKKHLARLAVKPNFVSTSFSGGTHAVWLLERPLPLMPDAKMVQELLKAEAKGLKLSTAFGTLDAKAFYAPGQYYHAGWNWVETAEVPIPESTAMLWFDEALRKSRFHETGVQIPLDRVALEVEKRFPGRWDGPFELGARGVRFWDPMADNPSAAIVRENGMTCFTGPFPFRSWADIFGKDFVADHAASSMGSAIADTYYIGGAYWRKDAAGKWARYPRREIGDILQNEYGLNARAPEDGGGSEVTHAVSAIITRKHLDGVLPLVFIEADTVQVDDKTYLNTSTVRAMQPVFGGADTARWGDGFPWIASLLERLFGRDDAPEQLDYFLSWLAHAYKGALAHKPTRGQAIYVAGPSGCGKTFLSKRVIAPLFGGREEATSYLMGETRFNGALFGKGIWSIDGAEIVAEPKVHARYTALMKKLVANSDFLCEAKYRDAVKVPWMGRLVVTCNTDPESLRILPTLDINNSDKLMFFLCREDGILNDPGAEEKAEREFPAFAAFLAAYVTPEECRGGHRFGVKSYLHPLLLGEAHGNGSSGTFKDVVSLFLRNYFNAGNESELRGSACEIYELMCGIDTMRELMKGLVTPSSIGTRLGQLAASGSFPLEKERTSSKRMWVVRREQFQQYDSRDCAAVDKDNCPF